MRLVEVAVREERAQAEEKARREKRRGKRRGKRGKKAPPPPHKPEPAMEDTINDEIIALVRYMEAVTAAIAGLSGGTVGGGDNAGGSEAVAASDVADKIETEAEDAQAVQSLTDTVPADGSDGNGAEGAAGPGPAAVLQQPPQLQAETLDGPTLPNSTFFSSFSFYSFWLQTYPALASSDLSLFSALTKRLCNFPVAKYRKEVCRRSLALSAVSNLRRNALPMNSDIVIGWVEGWDSYTILQINATTLKALVLHSLIKNSCRR